MEGFEELNEEEKKLLNYVTSKYPDTLALYEVSIQKVIEKERLAFIQGVMFALKGLNYD